MNIEEKRKLLIGWISDIDEAALDDLIAEYIDDKIDKTEKIEIDFETFSSQCQYFMQRVNADDTDICRRMQRECCEGECPLWETYKRISSKE